jgi:hypothetical protein
LGHRQKSVTGLKMITISEKLNEISNLIDLSHHTAINGDFDYSNNLYRKAYIMSRTMLENIDHAMLSDEEINFLIKIIKSFDYEQ